MVAGKTYEQAIEAIWDGYPYKRDLYSWYPDLRRGLRGLGAYASPKAIRSTSFGQASGLSIYGCWKGTPKEHWVLYDPASGRLHDPLNKSFIKKPVDELDGIYKPFSRLSVGRTEPG